MQRPTNTSSIRIATEHTAFAARDISNSYKSLSEAALGRCRFVSREAYITGKSTVTNEVHQETAHFLAE
jgi:hypothetical protein